CSTCTSQCRKAGATMHTSHRSTLSRTEETSRSSSASCTSKTEWTVRSRECVLRSVTCPRSAWRLSAGWLGARVATPCRFYTSMLGSQTLRLPEPRIAATEQRRRQAMNESSVPDTSPVGDRKLTRREIVKGAAVGGAAIAATGALPGGALAAVSAPKPGGTLKIGN